MAKYTKEQIIEERKCGLKYFDMAVQMTSREQVIKDALKINQDHPDIWGRGWSNLAWAFGNAVGNIVKRGEIQQTWNLDEALSRTEMQELQEKFKLSDYTPMRERKPPSVPKVKKVKV